MSTRVELYKSASWDHVDQRLQWRWRFVSSNGRILADGGQGYSRRIDCIKGAALVLGADHYPGFVDVDGTVYPESFGHPEGDDGRGWRILPVHDLTRDGAL